MTTLIYLKEIGSIWTEMNWTYIYINPSDNTKKIRNHVAGPGQENRGNNVHLRFHINKLRWDATDKAANGRIYWRETENQSQNWTQLDHTRSYGWWRKLNPRMRRVMEPVVMILCMGMGTHTKKLHHDMIQILLEEWGHFVKLPNGKGGTMTQYNSLPGGWTL